MKNFDVEILNSGQDAIIVLDGEEISRALLGFSINSKTGELPEIKLDLSINKFTFSSEENFLIINNVKISKNLEDKLFEVLKKRRAEMSQIK